MAAIRDFAARLDSSVCCRRETPPQLDSPELGSPSKVWSLMCSKEELLPRDVTLLKNHSMLKTEMREILLDWLMEVCDERHLHRETFHLTADYLDRFLERTRGAKPQELQLFASTALLIATKMEEIYPPTASEIADHTDDYCTCEDILRCEEMMLEALDWKCATVTSVQWLALYLQLMNAKQIPPEARKLRDTPVRKRPRRMSNVTPTPADTSISSAFSFDTSQGSIATEWGCQQNCLDITEMSDDGCHVFPDMRCTAPSLMRGEFVRLATVLDMVILDARSLKYKYSELAAAVVKSYFQPEELILQITGFKPGELKEASEFVEPFVELVEELLPGVAYIPSFDDSEIIPEDEHNIQIYPRGVFSKLKLAQERLACRAAAKMTSESEGARCKEKAGGRKRNRPC